MSSHLLPYFPFQKPHSLLCLVCLCLCQSMCACLFVGQVKSPLHSDQKGHKSLGSLFTIQKAPKSEGQWRNELLIEWQGHLLSCPGQLKNHRRFRVSWVFEIFDESHLTQGSRWFRGSCSGLNIQIRSETASLINQHYKVWGSLSGSRKHFKGRFLRDCFKLFYIQNCYVRYLDMIRHI